VVPSHDALRGHTVGPNLHWVLLEVSRILGVESLNIMILSVTPQTWSKSRSPLGFLSLSLLEGSRHTQVMSSWRRSGLDGLELIPGDLGNELEIPDHRALPLPGLLSEKVNVSMVICCL
jgi:hypothetical protein